MKGITKFGTEQEITITEPMTKDQWRSIGKQLGYPLRENKPKKWSSLRSAINQIAPLSGVRRLLKNKGLKRVLF